MTKKRQHKAKDRRKRVHLVKFEGYWKAYDRYEYVVAKCATAEECKLKCRKRGYEIK